MFPRVLGRIVGRIASATCEGFHQFQQSARNSSAFRQGLTEAALFLIAPTAARPLVAAYRAWSHFQGQTRIENRPTGVRDPGSSTINRGLACYLDALSESDPVLLSPVGTMPFERCFR